MRAKRWVIASPDTERVRVLSRETGYTPLTAAVLSARGIDTPQAAADYLSCDVRGLHDPFGLTDMDKAVEVVREVIDRGEKMVVYGDYDVDGITATCTLVDYLRSKGAKCEYYIPNRLTDGYGLTRPAMEQLYEQGTRLLITVDSGITANEEIAVARELGMQVVITDHHECHENLPDAQAVVDCKRTDDTYPFSSLAGVGVAFKLICALEGDTLSMLDRYADLVALGTVADVMPIVGENRIIVAEGLKKLSVTANIGLEMLLREAGMKNRRLTSSTISYVLAPRINAAGRMGKAELAAELFLTKDPVRAQALAAELCEQNKLRQNEENKILEQTLTRLRREYNPLEDKIIVLAGEGWHQGVVGIVASRLAEKYSRPAFMICLDHGRGKGSCRSFGGFNLFAALDACAPLLEEYGGHELAAGFTILEENIPAFHAAMDRLVADYADHHPMTAVLDVDADINDCALLTCRQIDELSLLEPFGSGNPKPVLRLQRMQVVSCADVGGGRHLKMKLRRDGHTFDAIFFSANSAAAGISPGDRVDVVFTPQINEYRGRRELQLQLCDLRPSPTRVQAEQALFERLCAGDSLTAREAALLLPERDDFAYLWRFLQRSCAAGPAAGPVERLARCAVRSTPAHRSYGRTMVCFQVLDERGLIQVEHGQQRVRVTLTAPAEKVDLEQSELMKKLRSFLEP